MHCDGYSILLRVSQDSAGLHSAATGLRSIHDDCVAAPIKRATDTSEGRGQLLHKLGPWTALVVASECSHGQVAFTKEGLVDQGVRFLTGYRRCWFNHTSCAGVWLLVREAVLLRIQLPIPMCNIVLYVETHTLQEAFIIQCPCWN